MSRPEGMPDPFSLPSPSAVRKPSATDSSKLSLVDRNHPVRASLSMYPSEPHGSYYVPTRRPVARSVKLCGLLASGRSVDLAGRAAPPTVRKSYRRNGLFRLSRLIDLVAELRS